MELYCNYLMHILTVHVIMTQLHFGAATDCFNCQKIRNRSDCHVIKQCSPSQMCHTEVFYEDGVKFYSLGCHESVFCTELDVTHLIGRQTGGQGDTCEQCCSLDGCNKYLCPLRFTAQPPIPIVHGAWSEWGPWEGCSASCGIGLTGRYRRCDNPPPSLNGQLCLGDAKDVKLCNIPCTDTPNSSPAALAATTSLLTSKTTPTPIATTPTTTTTATTTTSASPNATANPFVTNNLTQAPGDCRDLIDCHQYYRPTACAAPYLQWAQRFCPFHCGFCPTPTPAPCFDKINNCAEYQDDMCSNQVFWLWREDNCKKFCDLC